MLVACGVGRWLASSVNGASEGGEAGDDWFTDGVRLGDEARVMAEQTQGRWIVELPELVGLKKRDVESVKSMLSRQTDTARMSYDRSVSNFPRQFVFIGTTNSSEYLMDETGNRRFWPVKVSDIDLEGLRRDRDQIWAEAVQLEARGESIELPQHLWAEAAKIQAERRREDPIADRLKDHLDGMYGVIPQEDFFAAIGAALPHRNFRHSDIVSRVARELGFEGTRRRKPNLPKERNRVSVYQRSDPNGKVKTYWLEWDANAKAFVTDKNCPVDDGSKSAKSDLVDYLVDDDELGM